MDEFDSWRLGTGGVRLPLLPLPFFLTLEPHTLSISRDTSLHNFSVPGLWTMAVVNGANGWQCCDSKGDGRPTLGKKTRHGNRRGSLLLQNLPSSTPTLYYLIFVDGSRLAYSVLVFLAIVRWLWLMSAHCPSSMCSVLSFSFSVGVDSNNVSRWCVVPQIRPPEKARSNATEEARAEQPILTSSSRQTWLSKREVEKAGKKKRLRLPISAGILVCFHVSPFFVPIFRGAEMHQYWNNHRREIDHQKAHHKRRPTRIRMLRHPIYCHYGRAARSEPRDHWYLHRSLRSERSSISSLLLPWAKKVKKSRCFLRSLVKMIDWWWPRAWARKEVDNKRWNIYFYRYRSQSQASWLLGPIWCSSFAAEAFPRRGLDSSSIPY